MKKWIVITVVFMACVSHAAETASTNDKDQYQALAERMGKVNRAWETLRANVYGKTTVYEKTDVEAKDSAIEASLQTNEERIETFCLATQVVGVSCKLPPPVAASKQPGKIAEFQRRATVVEREISFIIGWSQGLRQAIDDAKKKQELNRPIELVPYNNKRSGGSDDKK